MIGIDTKFPRTFALTFTLATTSTAALTAGCSKMRCVNDANCPDDFTCVVDRCVEGNREDDLAFANEGEGEGEGEGEDDDQPCPLTAGINFERPKPNVMFLVDRSTSMAAPGECASGDCGSKWEQMLALGPYLEVVAGRARFGLSVFPAPNTNDDSCAVDNGVLVPLSESPNVAQQIVGALQSVGPNGRTPITAALDECGASAGLDDPDRDNVLVLLTDGEPNCACAAGDDACERSEAIAAVERLKNAEVPVIVDIIGFGASATDAGATLSLMAEAAGTALPGETKYFEARTIEELIERLMQLTAAAAPCRFALDDFPAPEDLEVHLDDTILSECTEASCSSGYTYDQANGTVEFKGASCQALRDGQCHDVWFDG